MIAAPGWAAAVECGSRRVRRRRVLGVLALAAAVVILAPPPATGQDAEAADETTGWHIVRDGEKLMLIARDYLGAKSRWPEIWKLNPEIENPDFLRPGMRLRIPLVAAPGVPAARLVTVSGRVEDKPTPLPWVSARQHDLLREQDGIRTFEDSSTEMKFRDGTSVLVTEDSLVFVRRRQSRQPAEEERRELEIVEGQADIALAGDLPSPVAVEILVAGTTARPRAGDGVAAQTRARTGRKGGAELMVFAGSSEVEAGGAKVAVPSGMGTAVPETGPPAPPEKLLPAPSASAPEPGSEWALPDPTFAWDAVPGAASYTLEICSDPGCAALVRRVTDIGEPALRPEPLPVARLFWRVNAVSPSGLDGYSSPVSAFTVLTDRRDELAPSGRISLSGRGWEDGDRTLRAGSVEISVTVEDDASGVASWTPRVNGEPVDPARLAGPWASGSYTVEVTAVDRAGNRAELPPLSFEVDADPPRIEVEPRWVRPYLTEVRAGVASRRWLRRKRRFAEWTRRQPAGSTGRGFLVLAAGSDTEPVVPRHAHDPFDREPSRLESRLEVAGDRPQALVLAPGVRSPGREGAVPDGVFLWARAADEASVVEWLAVSSTGGELAIEAEDALGNRARLALPYP